jgi:hypothetical protein
MPAITDRPPVIVGAGVAHVPLTRGLVAIIDAADVDQVAEFNWYANPSKATHYAKTDVWHPKLRRRERVYLHRLIACPPSDHFVDHINGKGLDCRRSNLRVCLPAQNAANRHDTRGSTSGYRGVRFDARRGRWVARLTVSYRNLYLGSFGSEAEAVAAYDAASRRKHGAFASPNHA